MFKFVVIASLAALAFGGELPTPHDFITGIHDPENVKNTGYFQNFIIGGNTASPGQFPYQASFRLNSNAHFCGGIVANNRWIVSAAHCTISFTIDEIFVVLGAHSRLYGGVNYQLEQIINHQQYDTVTIANDVSVVKTTEAIVFNNLIQPIALGSSFIDGGVSAVLSGWGITYLPESRTADLQYLHVQTWTNANCRDAIGDNSDFIVYDHKICAGGVVGQGACIADSGGPLTVGNAAIGIASWGIPCAIGFPDVYDRVASHRNWIIEHF
ncbi:chymotrypsin-1-like [Phlebotomus papatasi]|uniref:Uncharacterized protein n=1 Tax=Phlebotomus papatasi TaxID=29031 RepID=A0A1B0DPR9_PHLPP|nr:chymotrypsin-1-like [Phlebotomus papatasi]